MDRGTQALITTIVFTVLAGIFIILRSISRFFIVKRPGVEDYLIIFAFVLSIGLAIDVDLQRDNGLGKHTAGLPLHKVENTLKVRQASQLSQTFTNRIADFRFLVYDVSDVFHGLLLTVIAPLCQHHNIHLGPAHGQNQFALSISAHLRCAHLPLGSLDPHGLYLGWRYHDHPLGLFLLQTHCLLVGQVYRDWNLLNPATYMVH